MSSSSSGSILEKFYSSASNSSGSKPSGKPKSPSAEEPSSSKKNDLLSKLSSKVRIIQSAELEKEKKSISSNVSKAKLKDKNKDVAIKITKADRKAEEIITEANVLAELKHENIIGLEGIYPEGDQIGLVLEFASEGTLKSHLEKNPPPSLEIRLEWLKGLIAGLKYLEAQGIHHKDLADDNLLIQGNKLKLKIADFGFVAKKSSQTVEAHDADFSVEGHADFLKGFIHKLFRAEINSDLGKALLLGFTLNTQPPLASLNGISDDLNTDEDQFKVVDMDDAEDLFGDDNSHEGDDEESLEAKKSNSSNQRTRKASEPTPMEDEDDNSKGNEGDEDDENNEDNEDDDLDQEDLDAKDSSSSHQKTQQEYGSKKRKRSGDEPTQEEDKSVSSKKVSKPNINSKFAARKTANTSSPPSTVAATNTLS